MDFHPIGVPGSVETPTAPLWDDRDHGHESNPPLIDSLPFRSMESIFRRHAGPAFDRLPEVIRRAHEVPLRARGEADVRWGTRPGARLAARASGLPAEGSCIPLELELSWDGPEVVWDRRFGGFHLRTVQGLRGRFLYERSGPATFHFVLEASAERLVYRTVRMRLFGIPVPRTAVTAVIEPLGEGWRARVVVDAPVLGRICEYEARMGFG